MLQIPSLLLSFIFLVFIFVGSFILWKKQITKKMDKETEHFIISSMITFEIFLLVGIISILSLLNASNTIHLVELVFSLGILSTGGTILFYMIGFSTSAGKYFFWVMSLTLLSMIILISLALI